MSPATAQPLKLEVGKAYRTRDGRKAVITAATDYRPKDSYDYWGSLEGDPETRFTQDGHYFSDGLEDPRDLISEWDVPDAEGWIQWSGGECPVPPETVVECRGRYGAIWTHAAGPLYWDHPGLSTRTGLPFTFDPIRRARNVGQTGRRIRGRATEKLKTTRAKCLAGDIFAYRIVNPAPTTPKQEQPVDEKMTIECLFECFANWQDARQAGDKVGMKHAAAEAQRFLDGVNGDDLAQPLALALRGLLDDISISGWLGKAATLREATEAMERAKAAGVV